MSNQKRLLVYTIAFAAASLFALIFVAQPLGSEYSLRPVGTVRLDAELGAAGGDDDRSNVSDELERSGLPEGWVERTDDRLTAPATVEQGETLGIISDRAVISIPLHGYSMLGDGLLATAVPGNDEGVSSLLASADGELFKVEQAERVWSSGDRILAFADGGRRVADVSEEIPASSRRYSGQEPLVRSFVSEDLASSTGSDNGNEAYSRIVPDWFMLPGPATAAAPAGSASAIGDALGGITLVESGQLQQRLELFEEESHASILALAAAQQSSGNGAATLYAAGGRDPTRLFQIRISQEGETRSSVELPGTISRPVHLRSSGEHVLLAVGGALLVYDDDLEPVAQRALDGAVRDFGFLAEGRLIYVYSEDQERYKVDVFYVDDLETMYSLSFTLPLDSIRVVNGALVTADRRQTVVYREHVY